ncbi:MAG TPA: KGG domain-containing protein [Planctomycetota bacterium]|nr:KGG domain-containing protein [Planctomycetota bacterium]
MTPEQRREIGRLGGIAAHERGSAHHFTTEEAREAGRKGGKACQESGQAPRFTSDSGREAGRRGGAAVSRDRSHMAEIGRRGARNRRHGAVAAADAQPKLEVRVDDDQLNGEAMTGT